MFIIEINNCPVTISNMEFIYKITKHVVYSNYSHYVYMFQSLCNVRLSWVEWTVIKTQHLTWCRPSSPGEGWWPRSWAPPWTRWSTSRCRTDWQPPCGTSARGRRQSPRRRRPGARWASGLRCDSGGESPGQLRARIAITREGAYLSLISLKFKHHNIEVIITLAKQKMKKFQWNPFILVLTDMVLMFKKSSQ